MHFTETVLLRVVNDVVMAACEKDSTLLSIDISTAFDTLMHYSVGPTLTLILVGLALHWTGYVHLLPDDLNMLESGLQDLRHLHVRRVYHKEEYTRTITLCYVYSLSPVGNIVAALGVRCHQYADVRGASTWHQFCCNWRWLCFWRLSVVSRERFVDKLNRNWGCFCLALVHKGKKFARLMEFMLQKQPFSSMTKWNCSVWCWTQFCRWMNTFLLASSALCSCSYHTRVLLCFSTSDLIWRWTLL